MFPEITKNVLTAFRIFRGSGGGCFLRKNRGKILLQNAEKFQKFCKKIQAARISIFYIIAK